MSIHTSITEAKIINSDYNKPIKKFTENNGKPYLKFDIWVNFPKKINDEWKNNYLELHCIIWNEKKIEKFLLHFDENAKNYITITNGKITNFNIDKIEKITNNGTQYKVNTYSNLSLSIEDFTIIKKEITNEDYEQKQNNNVPNNEIVDEIPY